MSHIPPGHVRHSEDWQEEYLDQYIDLCTQVIACVYVCCVDGRVWLCWSWCWWGMPEALRTPSNRSIVIPTTKPPNNNELS